jgi:hypothetical protein
VRGERGGWERGVQWGLKVYNESEKGINKKEVRKKEKMREI